MPFSANEKKIQSRPVTTRFPALFAGLAGHAHMPSFNWFVSFSLL